MTEVFGSDIKRMRTLNAGEMKLFVVVDETMREKIFVCFVSLVSDEFSSWHEGEFVKRKTL